MCSRYLRPALPLASTMSPGMTWGSERRVPCCSRNVVTVTRPVPSFSSSCSAVGVGRWRVLGDADWGSRCLRGPAGTVWPHGTMLLPWPSRRRRKPRHPAAAFQLNLAERQQMDQVHTPTIPRLTQERLPVTSIHSRSFVRYMLVIPCESRDRGRNSNSLPMFAGPGPSPAHSLQHYKTMQYARYFKFSSREPLRVLLE